MASAWGSECCRQALTVCVRKREAKRWVDSSLKPIEVNLGKMGRNGSGRQPFSARSLPRLQRVEDLSRLHASRRPWHFVAVCYRSPKTESRFEEGCLRGADRTLREPADPTVNAEPEAIPRNLRNLRTSPGLGELSGPLESSNRSRHRRKAVAQCVGPCMVVVTGCCLGIPPLMAYGRKPSGHLVRRKG